MSSTFTGITTALNALMAHRQAIDVAGQNVANANTVGYTRQRADLTAVSATGHGGLFTKIDAPGWGVEVTSITRIVDSFVDARQRDAHASSAFANAVQAAWTGIEQVVNEPSDTGISAQLSEFWSSWHDVANHPDDVSARSQLLSQARTLASTITSSRAAVDTQFTTTRNQLSAVADQISSTARSVADLNDRIRTAQATGSQVNELADQRDQLVLQLSDLAGATARSNDDGTVDVLLGGSMLVSGTRSTAVRVAGSDNVDNVGTTSPTGPGPVHLEFTDGRSVVVTSGQAGGLMTAMNTVYPSAAAGLDSVATTLRDTVNTVHRTGKGLDDADAAGRDFFSGTSARTLAVAITDPRQVAAAAGDKGSFDASLADSIAQLGGAPGSADVTWRSYVAQIGVGSQAATRRVTLQDSVVKQADGARDSVSGVSVDEEMTNLLMFQRAYEGAARVMTAVDQTLDTLINRTGLVGR
ncbi:MAG TPA: flagellar hook-associated protein FlgK [Actinomycetales bacterium]|nr:flagellar hook-associated protein FlgK [Actinomycetales bacterium]